MESLLKWKFEKKSLSCVTILIPLLLQPATKLRQGYVFTRVRDSVHRRGGESLSGRPPGQRPSWTEIPRQRPPYTETLLQRPPWTDIPLDRNPWTETPFTETHLTETTYIDPLDRDPPWTETPLWTGTPLWTQTPWTENPLWTESQAGVKTLPSRNFVYAGGKKVYLKALWIIFIPVLSKHILLLWKLLSYNFPSMASLQEVVCLLMVKVGPSLHSIMMTSPICWNWPTREGGSIEAS